MANSDWSKDVVVSETIVKTVHAALHKYRVTFKLLLGALGDYQPHALDSPRVSQNLADRLALHQLCKVCAEVQHACDNFEFHKATAAISRWVNADLSAFYIEAIKDTLYCDGVGSGLERRLDAQVTLFQILSQLQAMLAPFTPLLVQESWEHSPESIKSGNEHVFGKVWTAPPSQWYDAALEKTYLPLVMAINTACKSAQERARVDKRMASSLECEVLIHAPGLLCRSSSPEISTGIDASLLQSSLREILVVSDATVFDLGTDSCFLPKDSEDLWNKLTDARPLRDAAWRDRVRYLSQKCSYFDEFTMPDGKSKGFVMVYPPRDAKCPRCWQYAVIERRKVMARIKVRTSTMRELCKRCEDVVSSLNSTEHVSDTRV